MKMKFCCLCGSIDDLEYHHAVPKAYGGTDDETNILTLCYKCHGILHGYERMNIGQLTKLGIARAKARGQKFGNPNLKPSGNAIGAAKAREAKRLKKLNVPTNN